MKTTTPSTMKVTTVRFGTDLWALLEAEAARSGVSVAQYVREAALARAAFSAGARIQGPSGPLEQWAATALDPEASDLARRGATQRLIAALQNSISREERADASAVRAESKQARAQAGRIRTKPDGSQSHRAH